MSASSPAPAAASGGEESYAQSLARIVFALLVIASLAAFVITQRLKHTPTLVQAFRRTPFFSPTPEGHIKEERISFRTAHNDRVTVTVESASGEDVAVLAHDLPVHRYRQLSLRWNGRQGESNSTPIPYDGGLLVQANEHGAPAPEGEYHVRVELLEEKHTINSPLGFRLVRHKRSVAVK